MKKLICILLIALMTVSLAGCDLGAIFNSIGQVTGNNKPGADMVAGLSEAEINAIEYTKGAMVGDKEIEDKYYYFSSKDECQAKIKSDDDINSEEDFFKNKERYITYSELYTLDENVEPVYPINSWDDYYSYYRERGLEDIKQTYGEDFVIDVSITTPNNKDWPSGAWPEGELESFKKSVASDELESLVLDSSLFTETSCVYMNATYKGSKKEETKILLAFMVKYDGEWKVVDVDPAEE